MYEEDEDIDWAFIDWLTDPDDDRFSYWNTDTGEDADTVHNPDGHTSGQQDRQGGHEGQEQHEGQTGQDGQGLGADQVRRQTLQGQGQIPCRSQSRPEVHGRTVQAHGRGLLEFIQVHMVQSASAAWSRSEDTRSACRQARIRLRQVRVYRAGFQYCESWTDYPDTVRKIREGLRRRLGRHLLV